MAGPSAPRVAVARIVFYGKPSCGGNARQRAQLLASGHALEVRDLFAHPWTAEALSAFLAPLPPADGFNRSAVKVKSGEIVPEHYGREEALALLLADPPLIRRPLMAIETQDGAALHVVGWDAARLDALIGLSPVAHPAGEACIAPAAGGCRGGPARDQGPSGSALGPATSTPA